MNIYICIDILRQYKKKEKMKKKKFWRHTVTLKVKGETTHKSIIVYSILLYSILIFFLCTVIVYLWCFLTHPNCTVSAQKFFLKMAAVISQFQNSTKFKCNF